MFMLSPIAGARRTPIGDARRTFPVRRTLIADLPAPANLPGEPLSLILFAGVTDT
jgi:hypothetical protein